MVWLWPLQPTTRTVCRKQIRLTVAFSHRGRILCITWTSSYIWKTDRGSVWTIKCFPFEFFGNFPWTKLSTDQITSHFHAVQFQKLLQYWNQPFLYTWLLKFIVNFDTLVDRSRRYGYISMVHGKMSLLGRLLNSE